MKCALTCVYQEGCSEMIKEMLPEEGQRVKQRVAVRCDACCNITSRRPCQVKCGMKICGFSIPFSAFLKPPQTLSRGR